MSPPPAPAAACSSDAVSEFPYQRHLDAIARIRDLDAANQIPPKIAKALIAMVQLAIAGDDAPTVAKIGVEARRCSRRTVQRAKQAGARFGLLVVEKQYVIERGMPRRMADRIFILVPPTDPVVPRAKNRPAKPGNPRQCQVGAASMQSVLSASLPVLAPGDKWKTRGEDPIEATLKAQRERMQARFDAQNATRRRTEVDWGGFKGPRLRLF